MKHHVKALIYATLFTFLCTSYAQGEQKSYPWTAAKLSRLVDINNVRFHQKMLQQIARLNGNNRAAGTPGYDQSLNYVRSWLRMAGYRVDIQEFEFPFFLEFSDPVLQRTFPEGEPYLPNDPQGFYTMVFSGSGDVEGIVVPVDVVMPPGDKANTSNSGCEIEDFVDFPAGAIALIQRGSCYFDVKARNAFKAGASAVIGYNEGQVYRTNAYPAALDPPELPIPAVFASYDIGRELYELGQKQEVRVRINTDTVSEVRSTWNILATTRTGDPSRKVVVGAHLDSSMSGPGINDNGSGAAAVLETAVKMGWWGIQPKNKVVFAFWGAEENGLLGSSYYVGKLTEKELAGISLYLNFDMIGSPNWVRFILDGDGSDTGVAGPKGSEVIEQVFEDYFNGKNMPTDQEILDGRSDYASFMGAGIPVGGLLAGYDGIKTVEQAEIYGGKAGEPYDPNYHTARDTLKNVDFTVEEQMLGAMGYAVGYFAQRPLTIPAAGKKRTTQPYSFEYRGPLVVR